MPGRGRWRIWPCDGLVEARSVREVRQSRSAHNPGRALVDVAVMLADSGAAISDLAISRDQSVRPVASSGTASRVLDSLDEAVQDRLRQAHVAVWERD
ncbi:hypothetical protein OG394_23705 [Kribbella sp. NBC_01245]|nr:hypothetical protein [Kribbella sp. NBC_01245]